MNEFTCDVCGQTFSTERGLKVHKTKIHDKNEQSAFQKLRELFDSEDIVFDYEITDQKVVPVDDGFLIVSTNVPIIKLKPKYAKSE